MLQLTIELVEERSKGRSLENEIAEREKRVAQLQGKLDALKAECRSIENGQPHLLSHSGSCSIKTTVV